MLREDGGGRGRKFLPGYWMGKVQSFQRYSCLEEGCIGAQDHGRGAKRGGDFVWVAEISQDLCAAARG